MASSASLLGVAPAVDPASQALAVDQALQAPVVQQASQSADGAGHIGSGRNCDPDDGSVLRMPPPSSIPVPKGALKKGDPLIKTGKKTLSFAGDIKLEKEDEDVEEFSIINDDTGGEAPAVAAMHAEARIQILFSTLALSIMDALQSFVNRVYRTSLRFDL